LFTKNLQNNTQTFELSLLQFNEIYGKIIPVECAESVLTALRYALKRKVAAGMAGNFRGVCPILNRAIGIANTVCGL
jgi:hypothetical protein